MDISVRYPIPTRKHGLYCSPLVYFISTGSQHHQWREHRGNCQDNVTYRIRYFVEFLQMCSLPYSLTVSLRIGPENRFSPWSSFWVVCNLHLLLSLWKRIVQGFRVSETNGGLSCCQMCWRQWWYRQCGELSANVGYIDCNTEKLLKDVHIYMPSTVPERTHG